jgi:hypothetical protein
MTPAQTRADVQAQIAALQAKLDAMAEEPDLRFDLREVLDWLKTGFITCDHCSHEMQTETLDAVWRLEEIIAALPLAPAEPVDHSLCHIEGCSLANIPYGLASCGCRGARWPDDVALQQMADSIAAPAPYGSCYRAALDMARRLRAYQTGGDV